ncbi:hypothetical protein Shyhy01_74510 [Streptomyces hygroscopicus subsp. hygroscopicus]|nr:hypothetical protein Shyhy01_74510 [Streptomyces hygroscopicus subsp. hygroscopicus]
MRDIARPLAAPLFRRLWLGQTVNYSGDAAYAVALSLYLLPRRDAPHAIGLTLGATALGGVVTLLLGGALADRYRRSRVIVASDLMRAAAVAGLVIGGPHAPLWFLGALAVVQGAGSGLHRPAYGAVLRSTVPREVLSHANALRTVSTRLATPVGCWPRWGSRRTLPGSLPARCRFPCSSYCRYRVCGIWRTRTRRWPRVRATAGAAPASDPSSCASPGQSALVMNTLLGSGR